MKTDAVVSKVCHGCGESKPLTHKFYYPASQKGDAHGYRGRCQECVRAYAQARNAARREYMQAYMRRYRAAQSGGTT